MNSRSKIILVSITLGLLVWIIDSILDFYIFYGGDFFDILILDVPRHEIYIRIVMLVLFVIFGAYLAEIITKLHESNSHNQKLVEELQTAMVDVKKLSGFIPICASCKKIRDDKGYWNQVESYIRDHSEAQFSHGICPECAKKMYPDMACRSIPQ